MSKHGEALGVDLYALFTVANAGLPSIAEVYGYCVGHADRVAAAVDDVMRRPAYFGGDALGPVHGPLMALHWALRSFLAQTETSLTDTARALNLAVTVYMDTDEAAGDELRMLCRINGMPVPDTLRELP